MWISITDPEKDKLDYGDYVVLAGGRDYLDVMIARYLPTIKMWEIASDDCITCVSYSKFLFCKKLDIPDCNTCEHWDANNGCCSITGERSIPGGLCTLWKEKSER